MTTREDRLERQLAQTVLRAELNKYPVKKDLFELFNEGTTYNR